MRTGTGRRLQHFGKTGLHRCMQSRLQTQQILLVLRQQTQRQSDNVNKNWPTLLANSCVTSVERLTRTWGLFADTPNIRGHHSFSTAQRVWVANDVGTQNKNIRGCLLSFHMFTRDRRTAIKGRHSFYKPSRTRALHVTAALLGSYYTLSTLRHCQHERRK